MLNKTKRLTKVADRLYLKFSVHASVFELVFVDKMHVHIATFTHNMY